MYRRRLATHSTLDSSRLKKSLVKRPRLTEAFQNGTTGYIKFIVMWLIVIALDLALDFRLEFLWPCWLFLKRIFDSFKYKNCMQAFVLMGCTFCSDYFIYAFIPSSWIFFIASTYVWTQQLLTPERGVGLPVLLLWMVFVYVEACVRVKSPDEHWSKVLGSNALGYPIVMLGLGFKTCLTLKWAEKCRQLISYKNDFFYRLISTHAESQNLYHAPVRAFKRTNLLKLRYKLRYSGTAYQQNLEDITLSEDSLKKNRINGLLQSMNNNQSSYVEVASGTCLDDVSPLTGRTWNCNSMRTFLGHTVDPNKDFWNCNDDSLQESDSSLSLCNVPEVHPAPTLPEKEKEKETKSESKTGHKRSNNILSKMFDFREKPSAKVTPAVVEKPEVREARVTPIKKEKVEHVVEHVNLKQSNHSNSNHSNNNHSNHGNNNSSSQSGNTKSERKSKKNNSFSNKKSDFNNSHGNYDEYSYTTVKINLDKLKDIDIDLYFTLQNHLDTCQSSLRDEKSARLRSELILETMYDTNKKLQNDLNASKNSERSKDDKITSIQTQNRYLNSELDRQRAELLKLSEPPKPLHKHDRYSSCNLITTPLPDHTKCLQIQSEHASEIASLKKDKERLLLLGMENEEMKKQVLLLNSQLDSIKRNLRAETKVKMELFSALGDARRKTEEWSLKCEQKYKENEMLKQRVAEAMAVSAFNPATFGVNTTSSDTFYSANGF